MPSTIITQVRPPSFAQVSLWYTFLEMDDKARGRDNPLIVSMEHVDVPDARERLRRAFDLILRAAERAEEKPLNNGVDSEEAKTDDD